MFFWNYIILASNSCKNNGKGAFWSRVTEFCELMSLKPNHYFEPCPKYILFLDFCKMSTKGLRIVQALPLGQAIIGAKPAEAYPSPFLTKISSLHYWSPLFGWKFPSVLIFWRYGGEMVLTSFINIYKRYGEW